jgi:hypothetical protein
VLTCGSEKDKAISVVMLRQNITNSERKLQVDAENVKGLQLFRVLSRRLRQLRSNHHGINHHCNEATFSFSKQTSVPPPGFSAIFRHKTFLSSCHNLFTTSLHCGTVCIRYESLLMPVSLILFSSLELMAEFS